MNDVFDVVTLGEAMGMFMAQPGETLDQAHLFRMSTAGAELNVALGLARLGHRASWLGRLGDDAFGRRILRVLRGEGVDTSHVRVDESARTGLLTRDCHGDRSIEVVYQRAASAGSRLAPADVDPGWVAGAGVLHLTGITAALSDSARQAVETAVDAATAAGVPISLDPNVRTKLAPPDRWVELLRPLAKRAHLVLASLDEAMLVSGCGDREAAVRQLLEWGAAIVVIKDGPRGAWAADGSSHWHARAHAVRVVDPVGAGDAFDAGFLSGWLEGLAVGPSLERGALVAAQAIQTPTDNEGLPTRAQLAQAANGAVVVR